MSEIVRPAAEPATPSTTPTEASPTKGDAMAGWLAPTTETRVDQVAVQEIADRRWLREEDTPEQLTGLRMSIAARGIVEPLLLRRREGGGFEVVCGQRRLTTARALGMQRVPAVVRALSDREALLVAAWTTVDRRRGEHAAAVLPALQAVGLSLDELRVLAGGPTATAVITFPRAVAFVLLPRPLRAPIRGRSLPRFARATVGVLPPMRPADLAAGLRALRILDPASVAA